MPTEISADGVLFRVSSLDFITTIDKLVVVLGVRTEIDQVTTALESKPSYTWSFGNQCCRARLSKSDLLGLGFFNCPTSWG